jgi:hypothetical protein
MKMVMLILLCLADSQDRVKPEEQDFTYQYHSCTSPVSSFIIVSWLRKETENIDEKSRRLLTVDGMHHSKVDVIRLYIKRQSGGCGSVDLESTHNAVIVGLTK